MQRPGKRGRPLTSFSSLPATPSGPGKVGAAWRGRGDQPRGRGEGCKVRDKGECEGDPDLPGSSAVCSGPEERREALAGGTTLVQEDGFTQFRLSEASEGLNLGVRRKMGTWVSLGWYMVSPKSCMPTPLRRRIGKMERDESGRLGSDRALMHREPEDPSHPRDPFSLNRFTNPPNSSPPHPAPQHSHTSFDSL